MRREIKNRIGERKIMNCGEEAEIVEYKNNRDVKVKFLKTGEIAKCAYNHFKKGKLNPILHQVCLELAY